MLNKLKWLTGKAQEDWIERILHLRQMIWPDYQRIKNDTILKLYSHYPLYQWLSHYNGEVVAVVHAQLGGKIAYPCQQSRMIIANIAQWEQWLGHLLLQTGQYLVKGGLNPVTINKEKGIGIYIEPNVWVIHDL
ncbi:TPA: hypothetical protein JA361_15330 [Legionella pneumophila]|nr:hypothetical protein [Legionella pneumophila]HAT8181662.1 hypothetical protein [Legionella pneumophila]